MLILDPSQSMAGEKASGCVIVLSVEFFYITMIEWSIFEGYSAGMGIHCNIVAKDEKSGTRKEVVAECLEQMLRVLNHRNGLMHVIVHE
jgi:hypothetical protein